MKIYLGDFSIDLAADELRTGVFGRVIVGKDDSRKPKKVAVKITQITDDAFKYARRELSICQKLLLENCDHLVKILHTSSDSVNVYTIMELCQDDLQNYINKKRILLDCELPHLMRHIASGMKVLRKLDIVHRDLRPQNILMTYSDPSVVWNINFKIADFGICKILPEGKKSKDNSYITVFSAPEILRREPSNYKADIWSMGMILYYCGCGHLPYKSSNPVDILANLMTSKFDLKWAKNVKLRNMLTSALTKEQDFRMDFQSFISNPFMDDDQNHILKMIQIGHQKTKNNLKLQRKSFLLVNKLARITK